MATYRVHLVHRLLRLQFEGKGRELSWQRVCGQWNVDPARDEYGIVFAKDDHGAKCRLVTADPTFLDQLETGQAALEHDWLDVQPGWYVHPGSAAYNPTNPNAEWG